MTAIRHIAKAAAAAFTVACALTAQAQDVIKIGYTADQSASGVAELGIAGRWGFEAAIEDINKAGGILGKKVVGEHPGRQAPAVPYRFESIPC